MRGSMSISGMNLPIITLGEDKKVILSQTFPIGRVDWLSPWDSKLRLFILKLFEEYEW